MYRHGQEEIDAVVAVLRSGQWFRYGNPEDGHRGEAAAFESEWAQANGADFACFTCNGTAALLCCYAGLGLGPGDEVIVPGYTWIATALAPLNLGVIPVIVDVDESLCLDPAAVERAITSRTKAICPVHMNGLMTDVDELQKIADRYDLAIVEDACQASGARWHDGRYAGAIGNVGAYSFNFLKPISCGDGGMFVTSDRPAYERGLLYHDAGTIFRDHASKIESEAFAGINLRGNEILAALMRIQLSRLDGIVSDLHDRRRTILDRLGDRVRHITYNGDTGTGTGGFLGIRFADGGAARRFVDGFNGDDDRCGTFSYRPIDSGRHVYSNWEPLMHKRGSYNGKGDPFNHPLNENAPDYGVDMLPTTLQLLETTVLVAVDPDWQEGNCITVANAILRHSS